MSVYTAYPNAPPRRKMRPEELALMQAMIQASCSPLNIDGLADWDVSDMDDGA